MKLNEIYSGFKVERVESVAELSSTAYLMHHEKSGARLLYIDAEDTNKVFSIAFRTPPKDSTGVAHIMEHSVLCGSRKFPLKEPFVELVKGSLNTFLNAMTYPDKTMYPVASKNDKDFHNLMDVYLDAVFYPRVAEDKEIVMQEGWHYELDSAEDELTYKGVVYNEMKGVYSSPDSILETHMMAELFPDTTYGVDSGGNPDNITDLTYEGFQAFYKQYYHPANSYIFLYGTMDIEEQLSFIDEEYLQNFDAITVDSTIAVQAPFEKGKVASYPYSIGSDENEAGKTMHALTYVMPEMTVADSLGFEILTHALLTSPAAPLKELLVKAGVGSDISGYYLDSLRQPIWNISVTGSEMKEQSRLQELVEAELARLVKDGLDTSLLEASLNITEFALREADFGGRPIGLAYGIRVMDQWNYDKDPIEALRYEGALATLREGLHTRYFEDLIERALLQNQHKALVSIYPEKGLQEQKEQAEKEKLAAIKANMTTEEINAIVEQTKALKARQAAPDTEEALATIPLLELDDLSPAVERVEREDSVLGEAKLHFVPAQAKGINYTAFYFHLDCLTETELFYASLLSDILARVNTKERTYDAIAQDINMNLGGFSANIAALTKYNDRDGYTPLFIVRAKALHAKLPELVRIISELVSHSEYTDVSRLTELVKETKAIWDTEAFRRGHTIVSNRVTAQVTEVGKFRDLDSLGYFEQLATLVADEAALQALPAKLAAVAAKLFRPSNVDISFVGEAYEFEQFKELLETALTTWTEGSYPKGQLKITKEYVNEGIVTSGKVQYVAQGGNFRDHGFTPRGAMKVLETILRYEYLWTRIRVQGGAYGAFANFYNNGNFVLCSYRDPNLTETLSVYEALSEYLQTFEISDREMRKYIIGTMSTLDTPITPALRGPRAMSEYFGEGTPEAAEQLRKEVIACRQEDIRSLADLVGAVMKDSHISVMGNEQKIKNAGSTFSQVISLPQ
ncbi:insulinase family protein [Veillonella intestinalis]|uniref:insulinase family protein n=1 Tax=Veillonella intestinalis TaxID=2941341 RepID=UPI00203F00C3|nr:insulinase family protein [Veillonella intestinalis]